VEAWRHVVCGQNHDQVGNRMTGQRLTALVPFESLKLAAGAVLLSPFLPLLFMGEEYGEPAPFLYFVSHSDEALIQAVQEGRREEFAAFGWEEEPPDPQADETFERSRLDHTLREQGAHKVLLDLYRELIRLRKTHPALAGPAKERVETGTLEEARGVWVRRWNGDAEALLVLSFGDGGEAALPVPKGRWSKLLDSAEERWAGPGSLLPAEIEAGGEEVILRLAGRSVALYERR
jgi:maltooligosyltrehalose trehalohydrolase